MATSSSSAVATGHLFPSKSNPFNVLNSHLIRPSFPFSPAIIAEDNYNTVLLIKHCLRRPSNKRNLAAILKATAGDNVVSDNEDGVSLGTLKLPGNTDLDRFETLLFQVKDSVSRFTQAFPLFVPHYYQDSGCHQVFDMMLVLLCSIFSSAISIAIK